MYLDLHFRDGDKTHLDVSTPLGQSIAIGFFHLLRKAAQKERRKDGQEEAIEALFALINEILEQRGLPKRERYTFLRRQLPDVLAVALVEMPTGEFINWLMAKLDQVTANRDAA